jgi:hypothetical protein
VLFEQGVLGVNPVRDVVWLHRLVEVCPRCCPPPPSLTQPLCRAQTASPQAAGQ